MRKATQKKDWIINSRAFENLLKWLDNGKNSNGNSYIEMRRRLVSYFDRKNCTSPEDLADETLNRVARRIEEEGHIESEIPAKYCYTTARFVFMESLRGGQKKTVSIEGMPRYKQEKVLLEAVETDEKLFKEKMLNCLESCMEKLKKEKQEIILRYYHGEERVKIENRRALAATLGITINALSIRACRIRNKLEACVEKCMTNDHEQIRNE